MDVAEGTQGYSIRTVADELNLAVRYLRIGTPADFLQAISSPSDLPETILIIAHGDENGLSFGDYTESIDTSMLVKGSMPPSCIKAHAKLEGRKVVNPACEGGRQEMADAFLEGGVDTYIASETSPRATSATIFMIILLDQLTAKKSSWEDAWRRAAAYDDETKSFALFRKGETLRL